MYFYKKNGALLKAKLKPHPIPKMNFTAYLSLKALLLNFRLFDASLDLITHHLY